jgi:NAD(P)-dependent dehydrogenase (short-subunit alcohol dehydrogenase family)
MNQREVVVVIGAGGIGQAIGRRQGTGRSILLADLNEQTLDNVAETLTSAGHAVETQPVDVSSRKSVRVLADAAAALGDVVNVVHTAGVSPVQAPPAAILAVDLIGTALVLEEFGRVIAAGGAGLVVASMAGHMIPALDPAQDEALAQTPADELRQLPFLSEEAVSSSGAAYAIAKRANHLRVQAAAVEWGDRGARVNSISPGIVITPLALEEMSGPGAAGYQAMIEQSPAGRAGTTDEIAAAAAFLLGPDGAFVTGGDLLIDGGVVAAISAGRIQLSLGAAT